MSELKAPFPWFGGKRRIAHIVWERLGADVSSCTEAEVEAFASAILDLPESRVVGAGAVDVSPFAREREEAA